MLLSPIISIALACCTLVSASALIPRALSVNEVLIFINGEPKVVNKATYFAEQDALNPPENTTLSIRDTEGLSLARREDCHKHDLVYNQPVKKLLDWDVQMSSVIKDGTKDATVAVTEGFEIANSVTSSASPPVSFFEGMLSTTFGIEIGKDVEIIFFNCCQQDIMEWWLVIRGLRVTMVID
ncbi:hypothetical protein HYALB_00012170 [Hymenoscyphus albidus]|uniref:Uncharacterized protein n=1 Tax=Hymenoscyphus albidus TaxID=595503 RepID=A0A9N9LLW3_9HELO|nr:hypothetical protein HYALB_00012170 [Hymenoscyphus albidus]